LYRAHLEGVGVPKSVVVKLPTLDQRARSALCEDLGFYSSEVRFYQQIGLGSPLPPARPYYAEFDPATHDFVLVLEDLIGLRVADQTVGCTTHDAETVIDVIAELHASWWNSERLPSLPWLRIYDSPPVPAVTAANFQAAWPGALEAIGGDLSPALRAFGWRFPALAGWFCQQIARPPHTFLHGDLRLDQLFFAVEPADPPVTALDWQICGIGRGAYDVAYFLSQSLATETRRSCERDLLIRYTENLASHGINYPADEFIRDYRLTTAWCFIYPVLGFGLIELANDRQLTLTRAMFDRCVAAIEDHEALALTPD
ncbi:MAG: phosphotransferase family protein, partial [Mycobacterium sp.]